MHIRGLSVVRAPPARNGRGMNTSTRTAAHRPAAQGESARNEAPRSLRALSTAELGRYGEDIAAAHLLRQGMTLLDRNVRLGRGEIDAVALDGTTLVIVEVKTRRTLVTGVPQESVTAAKLRALRSLTGRYLAEHSPPHTDLRIDVIAVLVAPDESIEIEHLRGVHS